MCHQQKLTQISCPSWAWHHTQISYHWMRARTHTAAIVQPHITSLAKATLVVLTRALASPQTAVVAFSVNQRSQRPWATAAALKKGAATDLK